MAAWLAASDGSDAEEMRTGLSGGNCLVGEDYWLVGAASLEQSLAFQPAGAKNRHAARRSIAALDGRRLVVVGHAYADLKHRDVGLCAETPLADPSDEDLRQPAFHLDVFLTPTGETMDGKPLLFDRTRVARQSWRAAGKATVPRSRPLAAASHGRRAILRVRWRCFARRSGGEPFLAALQQRHPPEPAGRIVWLRNSATTNGGLRDLDEDNARMARSPGLRGPPGCGGAHRRARGGLRCVTR
jgi:hypothetical protein